MTASPRKLDDMEAVRGFAALGVVVYHYLHGFLPPAQTGGAPAGADLFLVGRPFMLALINGPFMVAIFFVLSSYVLTARLVREFDLRAALLAIAKRFPRLLPLTLIGSTLPAMLFATGLMANEELGAAIASPWLEATGGVKSGERMPEPSIAGGIMDSFVLFWRGWSHYNAALWSMKWELIGSIFALVTAIAIGSKTRLKTDAAIVLALGVAGLWFHALVAVCVATVFLTKYVCRPGFVLRRAWVFALLLGGLLLGSTYNSLPQELLRDEWLQNQVERGDWLLHGAGAMLILVAVRGWQNSPFQNLSAGRTLGKLSFPMYVLHLPIFASVASGAILLQGYSAASLLLAFLGSMAVLIAACIPVALLDEAWVRQLNVWAKRLTVRDTNRAVLVADPAP